MDKNSLSHTTWECKYHLVFAPKYRRQVIYGKNKSRCSRNIEYVMQKKRNRIIEAECCKNHIHMLVRIPVLEKTVLGEPIDVQMHLIDVK